ncbi:MAG: hypothetical protein BWX54_00735 [Verrucomicrobia bacterium ADurb.Bin018]|nr:MAG: hypothetical protein BWX54_00735 [Verrucomicrobia bacterium ADurb.Bin018]
MRDAGRNGHGCRIERIGVVGGFHLVFVAVAIGVGEAGLAKRAKVAQLKPIRQAVGIAILFRWEIGGSRGARLGHGDAVHLVLRWFAVGGPTRAIHQPAGKRIGCLADQRTFRRRQRGGCGAQFVPDICVEDAVRLGNVHQQGLLLPLPHEGGIGGDGELARIGHTGGRHEADALPADTCRAHSVGAGGGKSRVSLHHDAGGEGVRPVAGVHRKIFAGRAGDGQRQRLRDGELM